jgi:GT2 family glycosyltransferase
MSLTVGICIATHNRCDELERTLTAIQSLQPPADEILIAADGCTDGTTELIRRFAPRVQLVIHPTALGSIPSRNELTRLCGSDIFVSLDDDSYPAEPNFIAGVRRIFESRPRLAVASFPQRTDEFPETLRAEDFGPPGFVGSYANSSAAIRREVFLNLGSYPDQFFHMYEEPDFALRCVCAGWEVRHEPSLTIRHHYTDRQRNELRIHHRNARNELWSVLMRCPAPQLLAVAVFRVFRQLIYAARRGPRWILREPQWWQQAAAGIADCLRQRQPLSWKKYLGWMRLARRPITDEATFREQFGEPRG